MRVYYVDSSALVKRYVVEIGSSWITSLTDPHSGDAIWISTITAVEVVAAFFRRVKAGTLALAQAQSSERQWRAEFLTHYATLTSSSSVIQRAMSLAARYQLRGYDAVQLATSLDLRDLCHSDQRPLPTLISADQELNQAALAEGLLVDDPNLHP